jgi:hypothetical protein
MNVPVGAPVTWSPAKATIWACRAATDSPGPHIAPTSTGTGCWMGRGRSDSSANRRRTSSSCSSNACTRWSSGSHGSRASNARFSCGRPQPELCPARAHRGSLPRGPEGPRSRIRCSKHTCAAAADCRSGLRRSARRRGDATEVIGSGEHVVAERVGATHKLREALSGWQFPNIDPELDLRAPNHRGPVP